MKSRREFLGVAFMTAAGARLARAQALGGFDVKTFGARGDGESLDTAAINRAIEAAAPWVAAGCICPRGTISAIRSISRAM